MLTMLLIPVLTFLAVIGLGGALVAARVAARQPVQARLRDMPGMLPDTSHWGDEEPMVTRLLKALGRTISPNKPSDKLEMELARAGYHDAAAVPIYFGAKTLLLVIGLAGALPVSMLDVAPLLKVVLVVGLAAGLSFLPNLVLQIRREQRKNAMRRHLPDAIDLLEICVSAGMGLGAAWNSVAEEIRHVCPVLADEMALTTLETHLGEPTAAAMRHMAERTNVQEVSSLTATLIQSERFGTGIAEALRVFAQAMREERSQRAQEAAEKMAVKLIFPMVLFIFPAVVIVMAGPAFLKLSGALG